MASDFAKPDKIHTLYINEIKQKMWPLSVSELFMLGRRTVPKLQNMQIRTIGDLANTNKEVMVKKFGKHGLQMWEYANGIDESEVRYLPEKPKGIGNSITLPENVTEIEKLEEILLSLSEHVTYRLRKYKMKAKVVNIQLRTKDFIDSSHQEKLEYPTASTKEIYKKAKNLLISMYKPYTPIRLIGLRVEGLEENEMQQTTLFEPWDNEKQEKLDKVVDELKIKYGYNFITRAGRLDVKDLKFKGKE